MSNPLKTIVYMIPIGIITHQYYVKQYGDYSINWDMGYILNFFAHHPNRMSFAVLLFAGLFLSLFAFETKTLPTILAVIVKPFNIVRHRTTYIRTKYMIRKFAYRAYRAPIWSRISEFNIPPQEMIADCMYWVMTAALWWFCYPNWYMLLLLIGITLYQLFMVKIIITFYEHELN